MRWRVNTYVTSRMFVTCPIVLHVVSKGVACVGDLISQDPG